MMQISVWLDTISLPRRWRVSRDTVDDRSLVSSVYLYDYPTFDTARAVAMAIAIKEGLPAYYWPAQGQQVLLTAADVALGVYHASDLS